MQNTQNLLPRETLTTWTWLFSRAVHNGLIGLSKMIEADIQPDSMNIIWLPANMGSFVPVASSVPLVSVVLSIEGDATGNMLLTKEVHCAYSIIDKLLGRDPGETSELDDMGKSILGEMGNIAGSYFLNELSDSTGLTLMPSPPEVSLLPAGSNVIERSAGLIENGETRIMVRTDYSSVNTNITGSFMVFPAAELMNALMNNSIMHPG